MKKKRISSKCIGPEAWEGEQQGTAAHMVLKGNFPAKAESTGHNPWPALVKDKITDNNNMFCFPNVICLPDRPVCNVFMCKIRMKTGQKENNITENTGQKEKSTSANADPCNWNKMLHIFKVPLASHIFHFRLNKSVFSPQYQISITSGILLLITLFKTCNRPGRGVRRFWHPHLKKREPEVRRVHTHLSFHHIAWCWTYIVTLAYCWFRSLERPPWIFMGIWSCSLKSALDPEYHELPESQLWARSSSLHSHPYKDQAFSQWFKVQPIVDTELLSPLLLRGSLLLSSIRSSSFPLVPEGASVLENKQYSPTQDPAFPHSLFLSQNTNSDAETEQKQRATVGLPKGSTQSPGFLCFSKSASLFLWFSVLLPSCKRGKWTEKLIDWAMLLRYYRVSELETLNL